MRVGILSFAHVHAEGYAEVLRGLPGVELVGFCDPDDARAGRFARVYGLRRYGSAEALLAEGLDAVAVTSENALHRPLVEAAARAGTAVLVEKPIATTVEDALAMRRAVEAAGVPFMTAFPMRFSPAVRAARAMILEDRIGPVRALVGVNHSENPRRHRAWFADPELAGGGAVMDHTVHLADLYRWFLGEEVAEVYAEISNPFDPEVEVDTAGLLSLRMAGGASASIDASWSRPAHYPRWGHLRIEAVGERGTLVLDAFAGHLHGWTAGGYRWFGYHPDPARAMWQAFLTSVREEREPPVTWRDGFEAMRVALAAYRSAREGRPVAPAEL